MNIEEYFSEKQESLKKVYQAFRKTPYGRKLDLPKWSVNTYNDFKALPVIDSKEVDFNDLLIPANNLWKFKTSGVSGRIKTVYRDIGTIVGYPKEMDETLRNNKTVFLHSKRREGESYYETHDFNHKRMYPNGIFAEYETRKQLLEYVQRGNILFIIEYPLMVQWICYQLEKAIENKEVPLEKLTKEKVYLELSGEPVTSEQVNDIVKRMENIFQCDVEYFVTYGANEIGHIGTYVPALHGSEIIYEVIPSLFIEEIDGELIITPFSTKGTILFRYKIGDKGQLVFRNGSPFVKVFGESQEDTLYIAGAQVDIQSLVGYIKRTTDHYIGLVLQKNEHPKKGRYSLNINVHTFHELNEDVKNKISTLIKNFIMNSASLYVENHLGIVEIVVRYSNKPIKKQWVIQSGGDIDE